MLHCWGCSPLLLVHYLPKIHIKYRVMANLYERWWLKFHSQNSLTLLNSFSPCLLGLICWIYSRTRRKQGLCFYIHLQPPNSRRIQLWTKLKGLQKRKNFIIPRLTALDMAKDFFFLFFSYINYIMYAFRRKIY